MKIELKVPYLNRINELIGLPVDTIIVGHETCPNHIDSVEDYIKAFEKLESAGYEIKFQVPFTYQEHFSKMFNLVAELIKAKEGMNLIVNDFGILYALRSNNLLDKCRIIVGSGLSYNYDLCPWFDHIAEVENKEVNNYLRTHNFNSQTNIEHMKEFGVEEIEVSIFEGLESSFSNFKSNGFELNGVLDLAIVSTSRACHIARLFGHQDQIGNNCKEICSTPLKITTTHYWDMANSDSKLISKELQESIPQMHVHGNIICMHYNVDVKSTIFDYLDRVILDIRRYSLEEIKKRTIELKGA